MLPFIRQCFFLFLVFFCFIFYIQYLYQYLFESLRKQQLRGTLLNIYVFNLINFTILCSLLATFFNTQENFQCSLNVAVTVIWRDNVKATLKQHCVCQRWNQRQINVVYFNVDINNVRQRRNNAVIFNVEFHNVNQRQNNVMNMNFFKKVEKSKKNIFELQKKDDSFD